MPELLTNVNFDSLKYTRQCRRCFMTGKACIYQRSITESLRAGNTGNKHRAFMLMPFRSTLDEVYRSQIEPCLRTVVSETNRADDISKTGYVICEKICRQIQESQIVCAEISADNPNVFYELGISYAINRNIVVFLQKSIEDKRQQIIKKLGLTRDHYNSYEPFYMLHANQINLWKKAGTETSSPASESIFILLSDTTPFIENVNGQDLMYSVDKLCRGSIHRAIENLCQENSYPLLSKSRITVTVQGNNYICDEKEINFSDVENYIRNSSCVIVCTSYRDPCSYFWLGFAHGLEKDVIPITVHFESDPKTSIRLLEPDQARLTSQTSLNVSNMPFDVRALWHIYFDGNRPMDLQAQIQSVLKIISDRDKDTLYRRKFWQPILDEGSVSIFVGSVELTKKNRHVVGEWDYRAVSELTSFFTSIKETMQTIIQTPTFQASEKIMIGSDQDARKKYIEGLKNKLLTGNSIIIASADVNDMTEVALATFADVEPFDSNACKAADFNAIIAFKGSDAAFETPSLFFQQFKSEGNMRGFYDIQGGMHKPENLHPGRIYRSQYFSYDKPNRDKGFCEYYGHIAKFSLPNSNHWTVVLQGITGPATLGVTLVLTGGRYEQFTIFDTSVSEQERSVLLEKVSSESSSLKDLLKTAPIDRGIFSKHSENITHKLAEVLRKNGSVEVLIKIFVMDSPEINHDERKIIWWEFAFGPRSVAKPFHKQVKP